MTKDSDVLELVAISFGVLIAVFFSYFFNIYLPVSNFNLESLVVFLTIPCMSGFVAGVIDRVDSTRTGLTVGLIGGVGNLLLGLYFTVTEGSDSSISTALILFLVVGVCTWAILASASARLAKELET